jgi:hypothetical protein
VKIIAGGLSTHAVFSNYGSLHVTSMACQMRAPAVTVLYRDTGSTLVQSVAYPDSSIQAGLRAKIVEIHC